MAKKKPNGKSSSDPPLNRMTGLLVIEVRHSNPNGDPDAESEPRTIDADGRGLISPVSVKRKLRDLVADADGPAWTEAKRCLRIEENGRAYGILESRGRDRDAIFKMDEATFTNAFWDGRVFGNTFLEDVKGKKYKPGEKDHFISTGVVQFGPGVSVAPIEVERLTTTNKAGVEGDKDRGMAPLGWRVVRHAVYTMPFFVNPMAAAKNGCTSLDIDVMKFLLPHVYRATASAVRPFVEIRHAWCAEHPSPLGSCPDSIILDALAPTKSGDSESPSTSIVEYAIPDTLDETIRSRLSTFDDLCLKSWNE
jgi:CRISPR-associated protein Csd2